MALTIKDGNGVSKTLKTDTEGSDLVPYHAISGTVNVTGTVSINQPITITSSANNPAYVTGTVSINDPILVSPNGGVLTVADRYSYTGGTYGALLTKITASEGDAVYVRSAETVPVYVSSSEDRPVFVVSNAGKPVYVTSSAGNWVQVTASQNAPVYVTSNENKPVFVNNNSGNALFVTSSNSAPLIVKQCPATSVTRSRFTSGGGSPQIDWASTSPSNISGTFILAQSSSLRAGLMFANNTSYDLYIAIGDGDNATTNGFLLNTTSSTPVGYSFILYSSGTYFADSSFVSAKHSGFFVSASNIDVTVNVTTTD